MIRSQGPLRIDNDPLPGVQSVDTITAASLVYRFF